MTQLEIELSNFEAEILLFNHYAEESSYWQYCFVSNAQEFEWPTSKRTPRK